MKWEDKQEFDWQKVLETLSKLQEKVDKIWSAVWSNGDGNLHVDHPQSQTESSLEQRIQALLVEQKNINTKKFSSVEDNLSELNESMNEKLDEFMSNMSSSLLEMKGNCAEDNQMTVMTHMLAFVLGAIFFYVLFHEFSS